MLKRINTLKNLGRFEKLQSTGGTQGQFGRLNVVHAHNGSGKSTICDLFRSLGSQKIDYLTGRKRIGSTGSIEAEVLFHGPTPAIARITANQWKIEPQTIAFPKVLVYDDRFVSDNVLVGHFVAVEQRRNIYGLVLGDRARQLKEAVDTAETILSSRTESLGVARQALNALIPTGWTPDTFKALPKVEEVDIKISAAEAELQANTRSRENAEAIRQRRVLAAINIARLPDAIANQLSVTLDEVALRAEAKIREHLAQNTIDLPLTWLEQGHRGHKGTDCPHCGQDMNGLEILSAYQSFFSGEMQRQQTALSSLLEEINTSFGEGAQQRIETALNNHAEDREWWRGIGGLSFDLPSHPPIGNIQSVMESTRQALMAAIRKKQSNPSVAISLTQEETGTTSEWRTIDQQLTAYSNGLVPINTTLRERQGNIANVDLAAQQQALTRLRAQKRRHEPDVVAAYAALDSAATNRATAEREKTAANTALKEQSKRILVQYRTRINELLDSFGVEFKIANADVTFFGGQPAGDLAIELLGTRINATQEEARNPARQSLANTLSGGDRSALALAFFMAVAEQDPAIGESIIVFDDPFHSQDLSRRRRTIECIKKAAEISRQCFVLSHELDFAREVAQIHIEGCVTLSLPQMATDCNLEIANLPAMASTPYQNDYMTLAAYIDDPSGTPEKLKGVARSVRQALEGYLRAKFPLEWAANEWIGGMIDKIRTAQVGSRLHPANRLVEDLTQINDWGKGHYHAEVYPGATVLDAREMKTYVQQTLRVISS